MRIQIGLLLITTIFVCNTVTAQLPCVTNKQLDKLVVHTIKQSLQCLEKSVKEVEDTLRYPNYANKQLAWKTNTSRDWTSGFYPGTLWYAYAISKEDQFKLWAK
jgi:unsaturated chondroitin disaccharide hydrolase